MNSIDTILHHIPLDLIEIIIYRGKTEYNNLNLYDQLKEIIVKLKSSTIQCRIYNNFTRTFMNLSIDPIYMIEKGHQINKRKPILIYKSGSHYFDETDILFKNLPSHIDCYGFRSWHNDNVLDTSRPFQIRLFLFPSDMFVYIFHNVKIYFTGYRDIYSMHNGKSKIISIFDHI